MSRWPIVPLKEHIFEVSHRKGDTPAEVLSVTNSGGFVRSLDVFDKQVFSEDSSKYKLVRHNDLAYNPSRINVGSVARCHFRDGGAVSPMYVVFRCRASLLPQYLLYFLKSQIGRQYINHRCVGAVRFQLRYSDLEQIELPIPPLVEQDRIIRILDEGDALKGLRAQADRRMGDFIPALFDEMFGDPVANPKGWTLMKLGDVCAEIYRYPTFYGFEYTEPGVPVARIGNIHPNGFLDPDLSHYAFIDSATSEKFPRTILEFHDIVMAVRGDGSTGKRIGLVKSANLIGANISPNLLRFKADPEIIEPIYLFYLMTSRGGQLLVDRCITRAAKKTITARDIKDIRIPLPPLSDQHDFVAGVEEVEFLEEAQACIRPLLDELFESLLNRAFRGEL
jgi:type I restriction enzyme, S subunit